MPVEVSSSKTGYTDLSLIADRHSGAQFWVEVARYLIGNLAGGKPPAVKP